MNREQKFTKDAAHAHRTAFHRRRSRSLRRHPVRAADSRIVNPDGSVVFEMKDVLVPGGWSQVAVDILAQKYFRRAGVPRTIERVAEAGVPEWLQRSRPADGDPRTASETDARQVFRRLAGCWTYWGWKGGYFSTRGRRPRVLRRDLLHARRADGRAELARSGSTPACTGPTASKGPPQGHYYVDPHDRRDDAVDVSAYEHPPPHACFIQSINDDLVNEGGIMDLWVREARIFKYGSGTGSNFSAPARRRRAALRRRQVDRPDELPQDRRPRRRRDQVGRHHAPRRQDGRPRSRPSRHRGVRQLEGGRGAEGRRPGHRLASCSTGT